jgi:anti-sigma-K factor RskA
MTEIEEDQKLVRQYLLGDLEDEQRQQFEQQLFADGDFFERVLMIEDELIEDFVFDLLPLADERKFVGHFLSTPRQIQKLRTARALKQYSERVARPSSHQERIITFLRGRQLLAAVSLAAILVVGLAGIWILTRVSLDQEVAQLNAVRSPELNLGINQSEQAITLVPIRVRSGAEIDLIEQSVSISPGTQVVQLRLQLAGDEYRDHRVVLQREPDSRIFTVVNLRARETANGKLLVVRAPSRIFSPGEYRLLLSGMTPDGREENLGSYAFRIVSAE